jgi:hypothetical protein
MEVEKPANCLNVQKFFETLAKIVENRYEGVEIKVVAVRKVMKEGA